MSAARVGIVMGSESDLPDDAEVRGDARRVRHRLGDRGDVGSPRARRRPRLRPAGGAPGAAGPRGRAGAAAHLPGVLASMTPLPVIGVPLAGTPLSGMDALLSIVQMPPGVPVATVAVGEMGARNAGHLAARILALVDPEVAAALTARRHQMGTRVRLPEGFEIGDRRCGEGLTPAARVRGRREGSPPSPPGWPEVPRGSSAPRWPGRGLRGRRSRPRPAGGLASIQPRTPVYVRPVLVAVPLAAHQGERVVGAGRCRPSAIRRATARSRCTREPPYSVLAPA